MTTPDIGTLYVLSNRDKSLAKIGLTRLGTPQGRAIGYTRAHGIVWDLYWSAPTRDVAQVEARCHRELAAHRFVNAPMAREVFHVTPQRAREIAQRHVIAPGSIPWRLWITGNTGNIGNALWTAVAWIAGIIVLAAVFGH